MICVGELNNNKNQRVLINAVNILKYKIPNLKLLIVGDGINKDRYQSLINKLELNINVNLLGYRSDVSELMGLSDVAISASRREGLPVNVMEAMATGLALVVSDCRGNVDLITNNETGYIVEKK